MKSFASRIILFGMIAVLPSAVALAQSSAEQSALRYLHQNHRSLGLAGSDVNDLVLVDQSVSSVSGVTHLYFQQVADGIPVYDGIVNVAVGPSGSVVNVGNRGVSDLKKAIRSSARALSPEDAVRAAGRALGLRADRAEVARVRRGRFEAVEVASDISEEDIPTRLVYFPTLDSGVRLAWVTQIYTPDGEHLWQVVIDAGNGSLLQQDDLTDHDQWAADDHLPDGWSVIAPVRENPFVAASLPFLRFSSSASAPVNAAAGSYRVYGTPVESPSHAGNPVVDLRSLISTAGNATASPQGWHSTGAASYTVTRGNNVRAGLDIAAPNGIDLDTEAQGGPGLQFDYLFDPSTQGPAEYRPAAVANLFYWNNFIHDVMWGYGFDEAAGNFQATNFTGAGAGNDFVNAEAQDYSGTNNANFSTPSEPVTGDATLQPRMQMYVWGTPLVNELTYGSTTVSMTAATWGGTFPTTGLTAAYAVVSDGTALPGEGCDPLTNAASVAGKIAVAYRGTCSFTIKAKNAQDAGAIGLVVINSAPGNPITLGGADPTVFIPAGMISDVDGAALIAAAPATITVKNLGSSVLNRDSDFDNGVIVHEYGHGISNRLTGGRTTTSCLATNYSGGGVSYQSEQMGEGWSDYYALLLTDTNTDGRGIGTYLTYEPTTGQGIRPYRYSVDMTVNPATYDYIKTASVPHGVGFVWASMVWDMTRNLVGRYGWDADVYAGRGGNNVSLQLVTEGLKLQPCRPGFVDGRDAILAADIAINGGANQCLIWDSFARRGLGAGASQGGYYDRTDGTQAFDLPVSCSTSGMVEDQVQALLTAGTLNQGQADALLAKLSAASANVASGKPQAAINELNAFIKQVQAFMKARILTDVQGQTLIDYALGLIQRIQEANPSVRTQNVTPAPVAGLSAGLPTEFALDQNFPNPSGSTTEIRFALPEASYVRLRVFDVMGREVATVVDANLEAGFYRERFDSSQLAAGTYVYRVEAGTFVATRQMSIVR